MSYFIDAKWAEHSKLSRIGHLSKNDAKDFLEDVLRYAAQDDSLLLTTALSNQMFASADYHKNDRVTKEALTKFLLE